MVTIVIIPNRPFDLKVDADTSSSAVLNYAQQQGLQFGTDLVYLYGPLGHLIYFYFSPHTAVTRLVARLLTAVTVSLPPPGRRAPVPAPGKPVQRESSDPHPAGAPTSRPSQPPSPPTGCAARG